MHFLEVLPNLFQVGIEALALKYLDQEITTRTQHAARQIERQLAEEHRARLIRRPHPTHIGGHIRNHKVDGIIPDGLEDLSEDLVFCEIALNEGYVGDAVHRQNVRCDQPTLVADDPTGDLRPATRRRTEVDHRHARAQDAILLLDFQQLVAGARTVAVALGHFHVRIVEMFFQPPRAGLGACQADTSSVRPCTSRVH